MELGLVKSVGGRPPDGVVNAMEALRVIGSVLLNLERLEMAAAMHLVKVKSAQCRKDSGAEGDDEGGSSDGAEDEEGEEGDEEMESEDEE